MRMIVSDGAGFSIELNFLKLHLINESTRETKSYELCYYSSGGATDSKMKLLVLK